MTARSKTPVREGSAQKRAGILEAARNLFLSEGYGRSSVDAVAARAGVSKRTVYDYYGDKQALLLAVLEEAGQSLMTSVRSAIAQHLVDVDVDDLGLALIAFARQIATDTFSSSDYAVLRRLFATEASYLPELSSHWLANAPEEAIADQFAAFTNAGRLDTPDPRLAADHFIALTFLLALNNTMPGSVNASGRVEQAILDGVPAFLRAYSPRREHSPATEGS